MEVNLNDFLLCDIDKRLALLLKSTKEEKERRPKRKRERESLFLWQPESKDHIQALPDNKSDNHVKSSYVSLYSNR